MTYTTFNRKQFDAKLEPMFLGEPVNIARYDEQKYTLFERLIERQLSFFWRPEEVAMDKDYAQFWALPEHEREIFISNLKYQTLLDSVQARGVNITLLPIVSLPELETWVETWAFSETIHSRSYTHIVRGLFSQPQEVFDKIIIDEAIIKRAESITREYDKLYDLVCRHQANGDVPKNELATQVYRALIVLNALEAIRFYVSFACTFAFGERNGLLESNTKIMRLIARDEALHCHGTQEMIRFMRIGREGADWQAIAASQEQFLWNTMREVSEQEMEWADHLFRDGSMIGLNAEILKAYVKYRTNVSMARLGVSKPLYPEVTSDPLPWMDNWLLSSNVQVAPQEAEMSSYLVGQIDASIDVGALAEMEL